MRKEQLSVLSPAELLKYLCRIFPCLVLAFILTIQNVSAESECRPIRQIYNFAQGEVEGFGFVFIGVEILKESNAGPNTAIARVDKVYRYPLLQKDGTTRLTIVHRKNLGSFQYDPTKQTFVQIHSKQIMSGLLDQIQEFELPTTAYLNRPICQNQ